MKITNITRLLLLFILTAAMLFLAGCGAGKEAPVMTEDGEQLVLTEDQIGSESFPYGFYVLRDTGENKSFTPLMKDVAGYTDYDPDSANATANTESGRYFWWLDREDKKGTMIVHEKLVPVVTDKTPLVAIYDMNNEMPETCFLERYLYLGYTLGGKFYIGEDDRSVYFSKADDELMPRSSFAQIISNADDDNDDLIEMLSINEIPAEDLISNIDTEVGIMTGFSKKDYGKYYDVEFYLGTKSYKIQPIVDTQAFKSAGIMELGTPFKKTKQGYYIVNLPENLEEGFYYINNFGLFKYEPGTKNVENEMEIKE